MVGDFDGVLKLVGLVLAPQDLPEVTLSKLVEGDKLFFEPGLCLLLLLVNIATYLLWLHLLGLLLRTGLHKLGDLRRRHLRMLPLSIREVVPIISIERTTNYRLVVHRSICPRDLGVSFEYFVMVIVDGCLRTVAHKRSEFVSTSMDLRLM